jgi:hypothetical protein
MKCDKVGRDSKAQILNPFLIFKFWFTATSAAQFEGTSACNISRSVTINQEKINCNNPACHLDVKF